MAAAPAPEDGFSHADNRLRDRDPPPRAYRPRRALHGVRATNRPHPVASVPWRRPPSGRPRPRPADTDRPPRPRGACRDRGRQRPDRGRRALHRAAAGGRCGRNRDRRRRRMARPRHRSSTDEPARRPRPRRGRHAPAGLRQRRQPPRARLDRARRRHCRGPRRRRDRLQHRARSPDRGTEGRLMIATTEQYAAMLDAAAAGGYALAAVNVTSSETLNGAMRGFAEAGADGIIEITTGGAEFASGGAVRDMALGARALSEYARVLSERYPVAIALHTDHAPPDKFDAFVRPLIAESRRRVAAGAEPLFQSHMFDGSTLPHEENLAFSAGVVGELGPPGVVLEGERGVVGVEGGGGARA